MGPPRKTTAEMVRALKEGRDWEENWRDLFARYNGPLTRFFQKKGMSLKESEDLTQEVFFCVYRRLAGVHEEEKFEDWLFRIAENLYVSQIRRMRAKKRDTSQASVEGELRGSGALLRAAAPGPNPETAILEKERREKLRQALHELPPQMRRCVQLRVDDTSTKDIAALLRISINTVKAHLQRAKGILREKLGPNFAEEVERLKAEDQ